LRITADAGALTTTSGRAKNTQKLLQNGWTSPARCVTCTFMNSVSHIPTKPAAQHPPGATKPPTPPALALLGHDLRAALAEVIGGLRLVDPRFLNAAAALQIDRTRAATEALALLMEQALAIILGEPALPALNPNRTVHSQRALADLTLRWQSRARHAGLTFELDAAANLPANLPLNPVIFERIVSNLLENAVKYSRTGCITLRLAVSAAGLHLDVADEGPGFSPEALACIFAPNCRQTDNTAPGTGMGLHIVQQIVADLGGSVTARNRSKGGAKVQVILPLTTTANLADADADLPNLAGLRVLVADDNATNREMLRILLVQMGAVVSFAVDGVDAIEQLARDPVDLLIVDIEMPRLSGIDVIRHLRHPSSPLRTLPVIAVTAYMLRANKLAIAAAGADATVSKTRLCPRNLALAIIRALPAAATAQFYAGRPANRAATLPELDPGHLARLLQLAGPASAAELLGHLLADLTTCETALLQAAEGPDWPVLQSKSHILIAVAGVAGAKRLQTQAEALNQMALTGQRGPEFVLFFRDLMESLDTTIHFVSRQIGATEAAP
jgi:two-component system, OmpR family, aerobic respiration control sensor histidine kinase ArcB